ncbi:MAG TPA: flagellar hook-length control protein FliK [Burkholderiaceae bacterium]|jgi:flagellar hook-length control protein FliK|nr:flagellar hook-length control protein FliK [Burkholderiaceae bacterium]
MVSPALPALAVATPPVAPTAPSAAPAQPGHFAKELSRHTQEASPKHEASTSNKTSEDHASADAPSEAKPAVKGRGRETARAPAKAAAKTPAREAATSDAAVTDEEHAQDKEHAPDAAADLSAWIATLNRPGVPPATPAAPQGEALPGEEEAAASKAQGLIPPAAAQAQDTAKDEAGERLERSASGFATALAARTQDAPVSPLHDKNAASALIQKLDGSSTSATPLPPTVQAAAAQPAPANAAPLPVTASVAAHTHSDEFAPAIAAQVSILARDGVHEAQLHLNPAETGPIAVRIEVVAAQAHIDFSAEQAATRSAIEASLPDLAAALRDAGLTLAGGGVFQQSARQQRGETEAERGSRVAGTRRVETADATPVAPVRRNVRAGGLDLYA